MLKLRESHVEFIKSHGAEGYPHEVCGIFLGTGNGDDREVVEIKRAGNLNLDRAHDRYEMDPQDMIKAEKEGRDKGLDIVGFYHSHPDHPDAPSEFDRERAWPYYSYLIVSVKKGKEFAMRSWLLNEESEVFEEEKIALSGD